VDHTFTSTLPELAIDGGVGADTVSLLTGSSVIINDPDGLILAGSEVATLVTVGAGGPVSQLTGIAGTGGLKKLGVGTLTLSQVNPFTGETTVVEGTLALAHASHNNIASSPVLLIESGATLDVTGLAAGRLELASGQALKGAGTLLGTLRVSAGATLAPGASPGVLHSGSVVFTSGSTFALEIEGATVGTEYDQLDVTGTVDLGEATLALSGGYTPPSGSTFVILNNDGSDPATGTFAGLAEGGTLTLNSVSLKISYHGGDGNDVTLRASPPTAASVAYFEASAAGAHAIRLSWDALVEVLTLGYLVDRARPDGGWDRATTQILPALSWSHRPNSYEFTDLNPAATGEPRYRLVEIDLYGAQRVVAETHVSRSARALLERTGPGLSLQVCGTPNGAVLIESATDPTGPWSEWVRLPLDSAGVGTVALATDGSEPIRLYRVVVGGWIAR
jgi:autotransporter-associated beta strand protein